MNGSCPFRLHTLLVLFPLGVLFACKEDPKPEPADPEDTGEQEETGTPDPDPIAWTLAGENPTAALMSISGRSADDVWTVGADDGTGGLILHFDGTAWERVANSDRHDLWWVQAFADGPVLAAGAGGTILRDDGAGFVRQSTPGLGAQTLYGLWGASPDDVWAVGGFAGRWGFMWHWDGSVWTDVTLPDDLPLSAEGELPALFKVWGRSADDVWVVGGNGTILHYDGSDWSVIDSGTDTLLFTVHGTGSEVVVVGADTVLTGDVDGFTNAAPPGVGLLQGACGEPGGSLVVSGQSGTIWERDPEGNWEQQINTTGLSPESLHGVWIDPEGGRWAVGGSVLTAALTDGVIFKQGEAEAVWVEPPPDEPPAPSCPAGLEDPFPSGSIARRWNEQNLGAIRRDIPRPGVHARNLFHSSVAYWDGWAIYDETADPYLSDERIVVADPAEREEAREITISYAAYRVLTHRYASQVGGPTSVACFDAFMDVLGLDPTDTHTDGEDPIAVGNRLGQLIIETHAEDGANETANYADTTGWVSANEPLVVDQPGVTLADPDEFQLLNLAAAETQNGIVLDSGLQSYIGAQWGLVVPFALGERTGTYTTLDIGEPPTVADPEMKEWIMEVIRKNAALDAALPELIDISPGAYGNNALGTNDGAGHPINPVTGEAYAPNVVPLGDFSRVLAEFWADGPSSETPPGHWNTLANRASDDLPPDALQIAELGVPLDRLGWDAHMYFALNGSLHDAAIAAWGLKREYLGSRPISLVRWMAQNGQSSDPDAASYHPDGLPLEDGVVELITEESAAPGERHHHLRWFIGEVAVRMWRGEPGDRANVASGVAWMRGVEWFPYQRRSFVTPAFPGYISGHSTFSRAGAEVLTRLTGSPYFPGGLGEYRAAAHSYLVFEDGPSVDVVLQWATYQDAADQAGQSRIYGGIHHWPDDAWGRQTGYVVGHQATDLAMAYFDGTARPD